MSIILVCELEIDLGQRCPATFINKMDRYIILISKEWLK